MKETNLEKQTDGYSGSLILENVLIFDMSETKIFRQVMHCFFHTWNSEKI